jgi:hypothetical protein
MDFAWQSFLDATISGSEMKCSNGSGHGSALSEKIVLLKTKSQSEKISMSLQKAYQMAIIAGLFQAKLSPNHELLIVAESVQTNQGNHCSGSEHLNLC